MAATRGNLRQSAATIGASHAVKACHTPNGQRFGGEAKSSKRKQSVANADERPCIYPTKAKPSKEVIGPFLMLPPPFIFTDPLAIYCISVPIWHSARRVYFSLVVPFWHSAEPQNRGTLCQFGIRSRGRLCQFGIAFLLVFPVKPELILAFGSCIPSGFNAGYEAVFDQLVNISPGASERDPVFRH